MITTIIISVSTFIIGVVAGLIYGFMKGYDQALDHMGVLHGKDAKRFHDKTKIS